MTEINDLPIEIIQEIFLDSPHPFPSPSRRSLARPSLISSVCRKWRDIALNFPSLWTHLDVVDPQNVSVVLILKKWMERAADLPLFLSVNQGVFSIEEACIAVVALFLQSLHRCKSLTLSLRTDLHHFKLGDFERQPSTCLESIEVWSKGHAWLEADQLTDLLFTSRTSLRSIRTNVMRSLPTVSRSWGDLRELSPVKTGSEMDRAVLRILRTAEVSDSASREPQIRRSETRNPNTAGSHLN